MAVRRIPEIPPFLALALPSLETTGFFYVFATDFAQGRCMYTSGVAVHFSAFRLSGYAFAPSFLAIFTFLVIFGKQEFDR